MGKAGDGLYVGLDVGGTNITAALAGEDGEIVARHRNRTPRKGTAADTLEVVMRTIEELLDGADVAPADVAAIGLGVAGVIDPDEGLIVATPNMNLSGLQAVRPVTERFGVAVALGNDVDVGTLGEAWLGAARGARSVVGIFVGTGIGGGVIYDGKLVRGARQAAGEIGHIVMEIDGPLCGCGNRGCFEALASRTAIARDIRAAVEAGRQTALTDILDPDLSKRIKSGSLKKALKLEDELVTEVLGRACEIIGYACLTVRHLLDPEVIVLGGGVVEACGGFMMPIIERVVDADRLPGAREGGAVLESELGDDAGVLGAVALAKQSLEDRPRQADPRYPTITGTSFGQVTVDGELRESDIYILADGEVAKRKKGPVKKLYGTSHMIGPDELARVCEGDPDVLVIGTGQSGAAGLTEDGRAFLDEKGIRVKAAPTPKAIGQYNETPGRKAALIHVTC